MDIKNFDKKADVVALLVGGWSIERQVSLDKGVKVKEALEAAGYKVEVVDVRKDLPILITQLSQIQPDVVFNNLHGQGGEDGVMQSLLEILGYPYTHSGVLASAVGMDKSLCKQLAQAAGVCVADEYLCPPSEALMQKEIAAPFVVKPIAEGSSAGVRIVTEMDNKQPLDDEMLERCQNVMVEKYIPGRELTVAVLDGVPQAVTEIKTQGSFFDYEAKYHDDATSLVLPAEIPEEIYKKCLTYAQIVYNTIGCTGLARCDFRYDDSAGSNEDQNVVFLEINTQPGLTADSIGPSQIVFNGTDFSTLCSYLVESALCLRSETKLNVKQDQASDPLVQKTV